MLSIKYIKKYTGSQVPREKDCEKDDGKDDEKDASFSEMGPFSH